MSAGIFGGDNFSHFNSQLFLMNAPAGAVKSDAPLSWEELGRVPFASLSEEKKISLMTHLFKKLKGELPDEYRIAGRQSPPSDLFLSLDEATPRFSDILCIKRSALKVGDSYLHANRVNLSYGEIPLCSYIATQAPIVEEGQEEEYLFWKAAMGEADLVIDLTPENSDSSIYYPQSVGEVRRVISIAVRCEEQRSEPGFIESRYTLFDEGERRKKTLYRIHYTLWEDGQGLSLEKIQRLLAVGELEEALKKQATPGEERATMVHCLAGVGRTGTYIVASALRRLALNGQLRRENLVEVIRALILSGRVQRSEYFVQTVEQLKTLFEIGYLLSEKPAEEWALQKPLQKGLKIDLQSPHPELLVERESLELLKKYGLSDTPIGEGDIAAIRGAVEILSSPRAIKELSLTLQSELDSALRSIKRKAIAVKSWRGGKSGYINDDRSSEVFEILCRALGSKVENEINFILNYMKSSAPQEVLRSPAYYSDLLEIEGRDKQAVVKKKAEKLLKKRGERGKIVYLFRDSSTKSGGAFLQIFSLSAKMPDEKIFHCRFAYNSSTKMWQFAHNSKGEYDNSSSMELFPNPNRCRKGADYQQRLKKYQHLRKNCIDLTLREDGSIINRFTSLESLIRYTFIGIGFEYFGSSATSEKIVPLDCDGILYSAESEESPLEFSATEPWA